MDTTTSGTQAMAEIQLRRPEYADGTPVSEGDRIRYHQALGGLMAPGSDADGNIWNYGTAVKIPDYANDPQARAQAMAHGIDVDELVIQVESGPYKGSWSTIYGHVIEKLTGDE